MKLRLFAFLIGMLEFRSADTGIINFAYKFPSTLEEQRLLHAYDRGQEWAHRLTFRLWDTPLGRVTA